MAADSGSYYEYDEPSLEGILEFDERLAKLSSLIESINRPGDYCTHGRIHVPMPRIEAGTTGVLAFPVQPVQVQQLMSLAERAPYGKGEDTILDRKVRDCWQIAPEDLSVGGAAWDTTLSSILDQVSAGLGCQREALTAELYKLLVYETGGFFAPHRDTEKANGMVATLVVALPAFGKGGELAIRHHGRETVVDMLSDEPSELTFAAFYADCEHEIRPVTEGHRVCLVYNLMLTPGQKVPTEAPDFTSWVDPVASAINAHFSDPNAGSKLVWVLEHDYSSAGLSFGTLKNVDAAVARVLVAASERSDCALYLAGLHAEETGAAEYVGDGYESYYADDDDADDYEIAYMEEMYCWLDDLLANGDESASFGELPLEPGELMPPDRIKPDHPDSQRLTEATGNAGATLERHYYRAAFVLWPKAKSPQIVAQAGDQALAGFLESEWERTQSGLATLGNVEDFALQVADAWPAPTQYQLPKWASASAKVMKVLCQIGNWQATRRFLDQWVVPHYCGEMNEALVRVSARFGAAELGEFLCDLTEAYAARRHQDTVDLAGLLQAELDSGEDGDWYPYLAKMVRAICIGFKIVSDRGSVVKPEPGSWEHRLSKEPWPDNTLHKLFELAWRFGLENAASDAAAALCESPKRASPDRKIPLLAERLATDYPAAAASSGAFAALWRHASGFLLSRSQTHPVSPQDWVISSRGITCKCEYCSKVVRFCADPVETVLRIPVRQDIRSHISHYLNNVIDIECRTEEKGRPYSLICTKTRRSYDNRMRQYGKDIAEMRRLLAIAEKVPDSAAIADDLRDAIAAASRG